MKQMERLLELKALIHTISGKMSMLGESLGLLSSYLQKKEWISNDRSSEAIGCLQDISALQLQCQNVYQELDFGIAMPEQLDHTEWMADRAIAELERRKRLGKYSRFLDLETEDPETARLLEPKKDTLKERLEQVTPEEEDSLEPYFQFLQAMEETDSARLVAYLVELSPEFGNELLGEGILSKKLFLKEASREEPVVDFKQIGLAAGLEALKLEEAKKAEEALRAEAEKARKAEEEAKKTKEAVLKAEAEARKVAESKKEPGKAAGLITGEAPEKTIDSTADSAGKPESQEGEDTSVQREALLAELKERQILLPEALAEKEFYTNGGKAEEKKFGVKSFINEVKAKYERCNLAVFRAIGKYDVVTAKLLSMISDIEEEEIAASLEYLKNKGYIREYGVAEIGSFFCISTKGRKAFLAKDASNFLKIRRVAGEEERKQPEVTVYSVLARIVYSQLLTESLKGIGILHKLERKLIHCSNRIGEEYFLARLYLAGREKGLFFTGTCWSEGEELTEYLSALKTYSPEEGEPVIVADFSLETARRQAAYLIEKARLEEACVYCYALTEGSLLLYTGNQEASFEELFGITENSDNLEEELGETESEMVEAFRNQKSTESKQAGAKREEGKKQEESEETMDFPAGQSALPTELHEILSEVYRMILEGKTYCAVAYLSALRSSYGVSSGKIERTEGTEKIKIEKNLENEIDGVYQKLAYAVSDPARRCSYNSQTIFTVYFDATDCFSWYLMVSAALRNFFLNHVSYDYDIKSLYATVKELPPVREHASLTKAMYQMVLFKETVHKGMDFYADYRVRDQVAMEREMEALVSEAKSYYDSYVTGHIKENASHKRFLETRKAIFSQEGELALYLKTIVDRDEESADLVKSYLEEHFIKDNASVEYPNVDDAKLNRFVDEYWDKAGETMRIARRSSDLMSRLRHNLLNAIEKVLVVMCKWIVLVEKVIERKDDEGKQRYKEGKKELLSALADARKELSGRQAGGRPEEAAGRRVLAETLSELSDRLNGSYEEWKQSYYYIDFLRGRYVLLMDSPEGYLPDTRGQFVDAEEMSLANRIFLHARTPLLSFEEKLEEIFKRYGDDYGSAELIVRYLEEREQAGGSAYPDLEEVKGNLHKSEEMAEAEARMKLDDFIETLELAQSYGQIEETKENKKEKIQKIASEWFDYAKESKNYGFFKRVLEQYRKKIHEDAKVRGRALLQELEQIRAQGGAEERLQKRIAKIQEMIENQNYTVAEDLLSKINSDEADEAIEQDGTDYLKSFIEDYDYNYKIVADSSRGIKQLVSSRSHNKDDRGANRLVDNWMSNGQPLGAGRLGGLLDALGFAEAEVVEQPKIGKKIENYSVLLKAPAGRKANYKHPIAAFGSRASEEGFRVVCLFGRYDADRLIEEFKNIGGTKNTLVLLDYALQLPDRRKLARKIKSDLNDKVFAVLDRVMLMFLVNNYSIQFINQILMSVMMPFSYYQPYVWDSSKIMPPEIFMGRKDELEKIESPAGVNIVYGGRQLGKSALLKMAKRNVDYDENQDRSVLVEIKGLNFERAAKKIGHELYDAGIFQEDIDTTDWEELARAIKRRLQDTSLPQIPYFLLLIDEADAFIESCEAVNFQPFDALKDIQSIGIGRFKFVIAGLHNIVRFKRDAALSNNSVLTQLTSVTVKPFDKREARRLLEEPLRCLGFRFPEEKQSLVSLILANTNYFPGLIQLYCANLIEAMRKEDYAGYEEANTPIYEIRESHIKKLLSDREFMDQIREKFEITLKLDEDNLYYIIALLMANLYYQNANSAAESEGFSAVDIIQSGQDYAVKKIAEAQERVVNGLMQELVELNILRQTVASRYLFSRYSFFQMMGTAAEVEEKLMEYMED